MDYRTLNPATEELIESYDQHSGEQIENVLSNAWNEFSKWRSSYTSERKSLLLNLASELRKNVGECADVMTTEMGKCLGEGAGEIEKCAVTCEYFAQKGEELLTNQDAPDVEKKAYVRFDPLGPIFAIMPWNFPFWQVIRFSVPAIMAGNSVILKHAPCTPKCALTIEKLFKAAGAPEGLFQSLFLSNEQAAKVITDDRIRGVTLTGSERAGKVVAAIAGENLKPCVLELGGSDPFIVTSEADLDKAIEIGVHSRCFNSGQTCCAAKRFIIHKSIFEEYKERFVAAMQAKRVGDPLKAVTEIAPLARKDIRDDLKAQVDASIEAGATALCGAEIPLDKGFYYAPTVLVDAPKDSPAYKEELFGPVATLFSYETDKELIGLANDSRYGLAATIMTKNINHAERLAAELDVGTVTVNGIVGSDPRLPFGGVKASGYGRELAEFGLREFVNIKTVWVKS